MEKDFFITAVPLIEIDGSSNMPTVLYYQEGKEPLIGESAFYEVKDRIKINEDFKVDLGNIDPTSNKDYKTFMTATGQKKSAAQLTADFFRQVMKGQSVSFTFRPFFGGTMDKTLIRYCIFYKFMYDERNIQSMGSNQVCTFWLKPTIN